MVRRYEEEESVAEGGGPGNGQGGTGNTCGIGKMRMRELTTIIIDVSRGIIQILPYEGRAATKHSGFCLRVWGMRRHQGRWSKHALFFLSPIVRTRGCKQLGE
jgi:hypothetical protein